VGSYARLTLPNHGIDYVIGGAESPNALTLYGKAWGMWKKVGADDLRIG
jgi:hypothetical protein